MEYSDYWAEYLKTTLLGGFHMKPNMEYSDYWAEYTTLLGGFHMKPRGEKPLGGK